MASNPSILTWDAKLSMSWPSPPHLCPSLPVTLSPSHHVPATGASSPCRLSCCQNASSTEPARTWLWFPAFGSECSHGGRPVKRPMSVPSYSVMLLPGTHSPWGLGHLTAQTPPASPASPRSLLSGPLFPFRPPGAEGPRPLRLRLFPLPHITSWLVLSHFAP